MLNREFFYTDPTSFIIPNDGVTSIYSPTSEKDWEVVRYELRRFVCEGEYQRGLERILSTFLANLDNPKQPAVWVSGFYGSGKSHLVRVLQYLWSDMELPDGARARSLVVLPPEIQDLLKELTTRGKQFGGLWAAAGKLTGAVDESVRLGLLSILFQCAGLPEKYNLARFVLWLKKEGFYQDVRNWVESQGDNFDDELVNLFVSQSIADGLLQVYPDFASTPADARKLLASNFAAKNDISDGEFLDTLEYVLELQQQTPGKLPLTLIVFDELQQFLGDDSERVIQLQNVVEACSARLSGRVLFVGTGQAALQATPQLSKLQDRFTVKVMLEDSDVETVVRQIILRKASDKIKDLEDILDAHRAEIDRHLEGTQIAPTASDKATLVPDYPLLPTRRRFWERVLRAIDTAGTAAQLRTQLRVVHEANRLVANRPAGTVVPADLIYEQQESSMLMGGVLLREISTIIKTLNDGTPDGRLKQRLCSLIFLISKLPTEGAAASGVKATPQTLADLLIEDLPGGSVALRQRVPELLEELTQKGILMKIDSEYRLQTAEGSRWEEDFRKRYSALRANDARIASERDQELRQAVGAALKGLTLVHGKSKTPRKFGLHYDPHPPQVESGLIPIWVQDEWSVSEKTVREAAQAAGVDGPIVYVFLPRTDADALRDTLAAYCAAVETLDTRPNPNTPEGFEARRAMESRKVIERGQLNSMIQKVIHRARIYQGGGFEVTENTFAGAVRTALEASLARMFPRFDAGDHQRWGEVLKKAQEGAADALHLVGHHGGAGDHPVCKEILLKIGAGKKGSELRKNFTGAGFGWPQDAVDGALLSLLAADLVYALQNGEAKTPSQIAQSQISVTEFRLQDEPVSIGERIALRGLASDLGVACKSGEEAKAVALILDHLADLALEAGGPPPLPERPAALHIEELRGLSGNKQLKEVAKNKANLLDNFHAWKATKEKKALRLPRWQIVQRLLQAAQTLPVGAEAAPQVGAIQHNRSLLTDPDPLPPLAGQLSSALRAALNEARARYQERFTQRMAALENQETWNKLTPEQRGLILLQNDLREAPSPLVGTEEELLASLEQTSLKAWNDSIAALSSRFDRALLDAARLLEPEAVRVRPRSATLKTEPDLDAYLKALRAEIKEHLDQGKPVIL